MSLKTSAIIGASWLALAGAAGAQTATHANTTADARDARIQELEQRLSDIETQLNDLKESTTADTADVRQAAAAQPVVTLANGRPTIATPDGNFKFALRGLAQFDVANYLQDSDLQSASSLSSTVPSGLATDLSSGAVFRRARIGFEGTAFKVWNYAVTYEAGGSGVEAAGLQQAYLEYAGWKPFGLTAPVRFRLGAFAVENTLEGATSNSDQVFLERPAVADLVRSTFGGDGRNAFGIYANGDRLYAGLTLTGGTLSNADVSPANGGNAADEGWGYVARIAYLPLKSPDYSAHVGANYSAIVQLGDSNAAFAGTNATTIPGGYSGASTQNGRPLSNTIQLRERPELRVDGTRLVDTGSFSAESARAFGVELAGQWRNFFLSSEWQQIDIDRPDPYRDPSFHGYYVQGAWTITGERRAWNAASGGYGGIKPTNNFSATEGHWGAWEIAARYSYLDLNDNEGQAGENAVGGAVASSTLLQGTTAAARYASYVAAINGNVDGIYRGGEQSIFSLGLNWYVNPTIRFLLDVQHVDVDRLNYGQNTAISGTAPTAIQNVQVGQDYEAVALRTQISF